MKFADLEGKRIAILGMGREGRNVLAALQSRLPNQTFTLVDESNQDASPLDEFQTDSALRLIKRALTPTDLGGFDVLIKSPGVSLYRPDLVEAMKNGLRVTSLTNLWLAENTFSRTIVVTGTKGKSTTASLLAELLITLDKRVLLRGNVGRALFDAEEPETHADFVVLELSSYQLADLQEKVDFALFTNLAPEHLDWHQGLENYYNDKLNASRQAQVVFANGANDELVDRLRRREDCRWFGSQESITWDDRGVLLNRELFIAREEMGLRGLHNLANVCAAMAIALELGVDLEGAKRVVCQFSSLPHRLEVVCQKNGRVFVDDSIASTPLATLAALKSWNDRPIAIILGGQDRGLPIDELVGAILRHPDCYQVEVVGAFGARFLAAIETQRNGSTDGTSVCLSVDLEQAVERCWKYSRASAVILLSPGAPSFDAFRDFAQRGDHFQEIVAKLH